ncbi:hypothetical protein QZH41_000458 [Actinostola sp. cb2023]|nr:hypothetical protein QZH41_000458 [Actinostola sp. cb2023]
MDLVLYSTGIALMGAAEIFTLYGMLAFSFAMENTSFHPRSSGVSQPIRFEEIVIVMINAKIGVSQPIRFEEIVIVMINAKIGQSLNQSGERVNQLGGSYRNGKPLSCELRQKVIDMSLNGVRPCEISRLLKVTHGCISKLLSKFYKTGSMNPGHGTAGRPRVITPRIEAHIERYRKEQPGIFSWEIRERLLRDSVCIQSNLPSLSSISRLVKNKIKQTVTRVEPERPKASMSFTINNILSKSFHKPPSKDMTYHRTMICSSHYDRRADRDLYLASKVYPAVRKKIALVLGSRQRPTRILRWHMFNIPYLKLTSLLLQFRMDNIPRFKCKQNNPSFMLDKIRLHNPPCRFRLANVMFKPRQDNAPRLKCKQDRNPSFMLPDKIRLHNPPSRSSRLANLMFKLRQDSKIKSKPSLRDQQDE